MTHEPEDRPLSVQSAPAGWREALAHIAPEAIRFDFDGYGWSYIDNGSGSHWRGHEGEPLYDEQALHDAYRLGLSSAPPPPVSEPVVWVIPGDDTADVNGYVPAMAYQHGEFTRPLYYAPPPPVSERDARIAELERERDEAAKRWHKARAAYIDERARAEASERRLAEAVEGLERLFHSYRYDGDGKPPTFGRPGIHDAVKHAEALIAKHKDTSNG